MRGGLSSLGNLGLRQADVLEFRIRGECMPSLTHGESVRVQRRKTYAPGDVVVVRRNDYWNAHRFLGYALTGRGIVAVTQADSAARADAPSLTTAIVGRVQCEVTLADRGLAFGRYARAVVKRILGGVDEHAHHRVRSVPVSADGCRGRGHAEREARALHR